MIALQPQSECVDSYLSERAEVRSIIRAERKVEIGLAISGILP